MIHSIKELKKEANLRIAAKEIERDEQGRAVINMTVRDDSDFLSVYSEEKNPVISGEVAEFIENASRAFAPNEELALHVYSDCIDEREQQIYPAAIKEYFTHRYRDNELELKRNNVLAFVLALIGVVVLAVMFFLDKFEIGILVEVVDIVAWVFLWESVDIHFLTNNVMRLKRRRYLCLMNMNIVFYEKKGTFEK